MSELLSQQHRRRNAGITGMLALVLAGSGLVAACSSTPVTDPYQIVQRAATTKWDQVQINVGVEVKSSTATFTLSPDALRLVIDSVGGRAALHVAVPTAVLGADAAALTQLGIAPGSDLVVDALYDGQAVYAKSPVLKPIVTLLSGPTGPPAGDLTGWLRLATKADIDALGALGAAGATTAPAPSLTAPTSLKQGLTDAGISLTFVGTEKRNGADQDHLSVSFDTEKLLASPIFDAQSQGNIRQLRTALAGATLGADIWIEHASARWSEFGLHLAQPGTTGDSFAVTVLLTVPDPNTSFAAPASAIDVPVKALIGQLLQLFGGSLTQP